MKLFPVFEFLFFTLPVESNSVDVTFALKNLIFMNSTACGVVWEVLRRASGA